jgi:hypothetical protein
MQEFAGLMGKMSVGEPLCRKNMVIYPISLDHSDLPTLVSLDDALMRNFLQVREVSESGSVPNLLVLNRSEHYVLILEGEEVIGGKQNRIFNTSVIVAPDTEINANVACCEAGRWNYRRNDFGSSSSLMGSRIRTASKLSVTRNLRDHGEARTDQQGVWDGIHEFAAAYGSHSSTSAYDEIKEGVRLRLDDYMQGLSTVEGQTGAFFEVNGKPLGLELLCQSELFAKNYLKIAESFATEALLHPNEDQKIDPGCVKARIEGFSRYSPTVHKSLGEGSDIRLDGPDFIGSGLYWKDALVHLSILFYAEERRESPNRLRSYRERLNRRRTR